MKSGLAGAASGRVRGLQRELKALLAMHEALAYRPLIEPSPNLWWRSRACVWTRSWTQIPPHGFLTRLRSNLYGWLGHMQSAPALMTLLVGVGFLAATSPTATRWRTSPGCPER
jgi:hypothetical protein